VNPENRSMEENRDLEEPVDMAHDDPYADEDCDMDALGSPMNTNVDDACPEGDHDLKVPSGPERDPSMTMPHLHDDGDDTSTSPAPSTSMFNKANQHNSKRKHGDLEEEESDLSEEDISEGNTLRRSTRNIKTPNLPFKTEPRSAIPQPKRKGSSKRPKKTAHPLSVAKSEEFHAHPIFRGSTYMHLRFIDLTQIEAGEISLFIESMSLINSN
jgi:hypothetical protein